MKNVEKEDRKCRAFVKKKESKFIGILEKMKKADPELCPHFADDDYYNVPAPVRTNSREVMIDLHRTSPGQLRRIIFDMVEWYAEGEGRNVHINAIGPRNPKTWLSIVFKSARFIG